MLFAHSFHYLFFKINSRKQGARNVIEVEKCNLMLLNFTGVMLVDSTLHVGVFSGGIKAF